jgi:hypothetical protein
VKDAQEQLEATNDRLAEIESAIGALIEKRKARLLAGDSAPTIASGIGKEISDLEALGAVERERQAGLAEQVREQEVAAAVERKNQQIARIEKRLGETVALARELESKFAECISLYHAIVKARVEVLPVFDLGDAEVQIATNNHAGAALTADSIASLLAFELYRQGARPLTVPGTPVLEPSWPRPICPRTDQTLTPEAIRPLSASLAAASEYAVTLMRGGRAPALLAERSGDTRSTAQLALNELLKKQMELASDPARESEYLELVKEMALLTDKVEAEREALRGEAA